MWVGEGERTIPALAIRHDFGLEELRRRLSNQRCCPTATTKPGQRSAQALTRSPGFDRARLLDAKGFRAGGCGGLFPHSNRLNMADRTSTMITMRVYQIASPSAIVVPEAPVLAMLVSCIQINSESIMAGQRSFISRSTSHVPAGIWLTSAVIVW
jgi:hypothetical protein